jgi:hypothetical protein
VKWWDTRSIARRYSCAHWIGQRTDARTALSRVAKTDQLRLKSNADIPFLSVVIILTALHGLRKTTDETVFSLSFVDLTVNSVTFSRQITEYSTVGRHRGDPCTSTFSDLLCNPLLKHSAAPHIEQGAISCWQRRAKLTGLQKWWPTCLILIPPVPYSHKKRVRPFHVPACTYRCLPGPVSIGVLLTIRASVIAGSSSSWVIPQLFLQRVF